jgi:acyl transferase domain-containing protein
MEPTPSALFPDERWNVAAYYDSDPDAPGKSYAAHGGFIENVALFDAAFFSIAPVEAMTMDPQQRLLLELSWEALERGHCPRQLARQSRRGVSWGCAAAITAFPRWPATRWNRLTHLLARAAASVAAGRLSYFYGLHGPSFPVDTACSSSLLAVHLACQSLRQGECDLAVAPGLI